MKRSYRTNTLGVIATVLFVYMLPATAQKDVWKGLNMGLTGGVDVGYNDTWGTVKSSHGLGIGGHAELTGYYYTPQFFWFDVNPYYGRASASTGSQFIGNTAGLNVFTRIFTASQFPGSINYTRSFTDSGTFGIPGVADLTADANNHSWDFNWAINLRSLPRIDVSYRISGSDHSIFGTNLRSEFGHRTFNIHSRYQYKKFKILGFFKNTSFNGSTPLLDQLGEVVDHNSDGHGNAVGANVTHPFVLHGLWSFSWVHTTGSSSYTSSGTMRPRGSGESSGDGIGSGVSVRLTRKLSLSSQLTYNSNSFSAMQSVLMDSGVFTPLQTLDSGNKTVLISANAYYYPKPYLNLYGHWNRAEVFPQHGESRSLTLYGGGLYSQYTNYLLGNIRYSVGVSDQVSKDGNTGTAFNGNISTAKEIRNWKLTADGNYNQALDTVGDITVTSHYGFGGTAQGKFGRFLYWTNSARFNHSALEPIAGISFANTTYATSLTYRRYSASFSYASASGTSLLTPEGLVPLPPGAPPSAFPDLANYDAHSISFGASMTGKRYTLSSHYTDSKAHTTASALAETHSKNMYVDLRVRMRKLYLSVTYRRTEQSVGAPGTPTSVINAFGVSISRWFRVF